MLFTYGVKNRGSMKGVRIALTLDVEELADMILGTLPDQEFAQSFEFESINPDEGYLDTLPVEGQIIAFRVECSSKNSFFWV